MLGVLGFPLYFVRNFGRALALAVIIVLAVMEVSTVALLTGSMLGEVRLTLVAPLRYFTEVVAAGAEVPPSIAQSIADQPETQIVLPMLPESVRVNTLLGPGSRNVFAVPTLFLPWFVERIGERLIAGRLPRAGAGEIALPADVMASRHLHLGDVIGQDVDPEEWLPGRWVVVGELAGALDAGVVPYEDMRAVTPFSAVSGAGSYAVFARPGTLSALDGYLETLPLDQVRVYDQQAEEQVYHSEVRLLDWLVWSINLVTVVVLSLAMGLLQNLYYLQRMEEYGILAAIGYSHRLLARRALTEVAAVTAAAWAAGLGLTLALTAALARWVFGPQGIHLPTLDGRDILFTLPIPLLIGAFTLGTVLRRLRRLDPVAVVERR